MRKKSMLRMLALAAAAALLMTGCACGGETRAPEGAPEGAGAPSGEIMVTGSTSAEPLVAALADLFMEEHAGVSIAVQGNGSSAGIRAAADGSAQLGMSSRELNEEEKARTTAYTLCMDGIAVIVNKENAVTNLTKEQISAIFKGEIVNWKELGGADEEILLISREAGSGTRDAFEESCGLTEKNEAGNTVSLTEESRALIADSTNAVSTTVSGKPGAIGYVSLGSYDGNLVTAVDVDGVACTQENILSGAYALARPFLLVAGSASEEISEAFLQFALSEEGQAVVREHKYIAVK